MNGQVSIVVGATGLVGNHLVRQLVKDDAFKKVIVISRRPWESESPKIVNVVVNFSNYEELNKAFEKANVIFCAVGTTQKKVKGDEDAYSKVDFDIPLNLAKIGLQKKVKQYILVSSVGADINANNFYLSLKGKVEEAICALSYESLYLFRPSMLLGKRNEFRLGESIGKAVMRSASVLFFGPMRKYYPVKAKEVAIAMIQASKERKPGVHFLHYDEIMSLKAAAV